jgi:hypothetical protein
MSDGRKTIATATIATETMNEAYVKVTQAEECWAACGFMAVSCF